MTVHLQVIRRILDSKDYSFIEDNNLESNMFDAYSDVFDFIVNHYEQYKVIPDLATVQNKFTDIEFEEVTENDDYLIKTLREEKVTSALRKIFEHANTISDNTGSIDALEYLKEAITRVEVEQGIASTEIVGTFNERYQHTSDVTLNNSDWFIPTGFAEIDADTNGLQRGDELAVFYARTNEGKSWISEAVATFVTEIGFRAGYFSPEMNEYDIGYRFDTLHGHISNNAMRLGRFDDEFTLESYQKYGDTLSNIRGKLFVTRPKTFNRKVTVSKLRQWIKADKLDIIFIDGITYLSDERYKKGDSKTISLTNISEDLMELSAEMHVPVVVVVQANRGGIVDKKSLDTPELENIRDSDGIAQNASIVFALRQVRIKGGDTYIIIDVKKRRGGEVGKSYKYRWDINYGRFTLVQDDDIQTDVEREDVVREKKEPTAKARGKRNKIAEDDF